MSSPRRIVFPRKGDVELQSFDLPKPANHEVRVATQYSLMSIGTETTILHQRYAAHTHFDRMFSFPQLQTGVQAVGIVEEKGSEVEEFEIGQRVFFRIAHRSHAVISAAACSAVPTALSARDACWCGLAKTAFRAAWAAPFQLGGQVLIVGAGPVAQMLVRWARASGMQDIVVVDPAASRLPYARSGGATAAMAASLVEAGETVSEIWPVDGPALIVDSTGNPQVMHQALSVLGRYGKLLLLGDTGYPNEQTLSSQVMSEGLSIQATHDSHDRDGWDQRRIDRLFFDLAVRGQFDVTDLVTHEFHPEQCVEAYQLVEEQRDSVMGLIYDWQAQA